MGFSLQGLVAHGRVQVHPVGHGEPLGGLEVVCIHTMPQAVMDNGLGRKQMEAGRPVRRLLPSSCEM